MAPKAKGLVFTNLPVPKKAGQVLITQGPDMVPAWGDLPEPPTPAGGLGFNPLDYGAVADAVFSPVTRKWTGTDNTAAFQRTMDACKAAGGSSINIPDGSFYFSGSLTYNNSGLDDQIVTMRGQGTSTRLVVDTVGADWLTIGNFDQFMMANMVITGSDQIRFYDCNRAIVAQVVNKLCLVDMLFIGLAGTTQLVATDTCGLYCYRTQFQGCGVGSVDQNDGCLQAINHLGGYINGCFFVDFGNLMEQNFSKTPNGMPCWIRVNQSLNGVGANGGNAFIIESCYFDEGGSIAIGINDADGLSAINMARVIGCSFLIGIQVAIFIKSTYGAVVEECSFNCNNQARTILEVDDTFGPTTLRDIHVISGGGSGSGSIIIAPDAGLRRTAPVEMINVDYDTINFTTAGYSPPPVVNITRDGVRARLRTAANAVEANTLAKVGAADDSVDQLGIADDARLCTGVILDAGIAGAPVRVVEQQGQEVIVLSDGAAPINNGDILTVSTALPGRVAVTTTPGDHTVGSTTIGAVAVIGTPTGVLFNKSIY